MLGNYLTVSRSRSHCTTKFSDISWVGGEDSFVHLPFCFDFKDLYLFLVAYAVLSVECFSNLLEVIGFRCYLQFTLMSLTPLLPYAFRLISIPGGFAKKMFFSSPSIGSRGPKKYLRSSVNMLLTCILYCDARLGCLI